jgi:hypothetical protein
MKFRKAEIDRLIGRSPKRIGKLQISATCA